MKVVPASTNPSTSGKRATSFEPAVARALREERGVVQDRLAMNANVDRSYYGKLERVERQPSLALLLRIAFALEIAGGDLVALVDAQMARSRRRRP